MPFQGPSHAARPALQFVDSSHWYYLPGTQESLGKRKSFLGVPVPQLSGHVYVAPFDLQLLRRPGCLKLRDSPASVS